MSKNIEQRLIVDNAEKGKLRYNIFKSAIGRIKESIEKGFFLESITLCESLISDRLESRLNFLDGSDKYSFQPLGALQKGIGNLEKNEEFKQLVSGDLNDWRLSRNKALHRMAKISSNHQKTWESKMMESELIAIEGERVRSEIFRMTDKLQRNKS